MDDYPLKDINQWGKTLNGSLLSRWASLFVAVSDSQQQQQQRQPLDNRGVVPSRGSRTRADIAAHQRGYQLLP